MERTVVRLFESREDATNAVQKLQSMGVDREDVSVMSSENGYGDDTPQGSDPDNHAGDGAATGASTGALLGGGAGLAAGLGMLAIPGLGPIVAAGWLASAVTGAVAGAAIGGATGGVIGGLMKSGVSENDARVYYEGINRGGTIVSVRNTGDRAVAIESALDSFRAADVTATGNRYRESGWSDGRDL